MKTSQSNNIVFHSLARAKSLLYQKKNPERLIQFDSQVTVFVSSMPAQKCLNYKLLI